MGNTGGISGAEIGSQLAVWGRALLQRDRPAVGLPGERMLFLGCGNSAAATRLSHLRFRTLAFATWLSLPSPWPLCVSAPESARRMPLTPSKWKPGRRYDRVVAIGRSGSTSQVLTAFVTRAGVFAVEDAASIAAQVLVTTG